MGWWPCGGCDNGGFACDQCTGGIAPATISVYVASIANSSCSYCSSWNGTFLLSEDATTTCGYFGCFDIATPLCGGLTKIAKINIQVILDKDVTSTLTVYYQPSYGCGINTGPSSEYTQWSAVYTGDCSSGKIYYPTRSSGPISGNCNYASASMTVTF